MKDAIMLMIGEDGKATVYDDTYDIVIHCGSQEEQDRVIHLLKNVLTETYTTWLGNYSPYTCERCGFHVDSKTKYCPECGKKAVHNVDESNQG